MSGREGLFYSEHESPFLIDSVSIWCWFKQGHILEGSACTPPHPTHPPTSTNTHARARTPAGQGNINLIEAALRAGVKKFVLVTSIGTGDSKDACSPETYAVLKPVLVEKEKAEQRLMVGWARGGGGGGRRGQQI